MTEDDWDLFDTLETDQHEIQNESCDAMDDKTPTRCFPNDDDVDNDGNDGNDGNDDDGNDGTSINLPEMMNNLKLSPKTNTILCSACQSKNITHCALRGYNVCEDCGVINQYFLDKTPEWTTYESSDENNGRCGCATNKFLPTSSLGTSIRGNGFSRIEVLHRWGNMPYKERSLFGVLQDIEYRCRKNNIKKSIIDNAKILYKNINETKHQSGDNKGKSHIFRGVNRKSLIAACVFYGAKIQGEPRSPKEIGDIFDLTLTNVTSGCRKFLDLMEKNILTYNMQTSQSSDFIERFNSKLKIQKTYIDIAKRISENINKLDIASNHQPRSVAAAAILLTSNLHQLAIPKKDISKEFTISEVTITKAFKEIREYEKMIINDDITVKVYNKLHNITDDAFKDIYQSHKLVNGILIEQVQSTGDVFLSPSEKYGT